MFKKWIFCFCFLFWLAGTSRAALFQEIGDAGKTLDTAMPVAESTVQINGYLEWPDPFNDYAGADLYVFWWNGGPFGAETSSNNYFDFQLFLFDENGYGIWANDDGGYNLNARIEDVLAPGVYYLGISAYDYDPYNLFGEEIFPDYPYDTQLAPQAMDPWLAYWDGPVVGGDVNYTITFSSPVNVPEPASIILVGLALSILGFLGLKAKSKVNNVK
ncbi:protein of unknown function DUF1555 [Thermodesulfatator indicus DSM 15286]|uniref:PEP-CTERM protein-sorting domain-containing protein n=1 Tax=Thermodesulfatator indicus (strain DSM 15286 / JCM 11887 / CIR29812) TaxID=667014 RepID=F8A8E7_THEID|nr:DVUA0089 family protein [Thermodesulfatator indicus]AEH43951.1 protein of unknown function DUF1555 [Thermodesulfatator indicus DSM 15286]